MRTEELGVLFSQIQRILIEMEARPNTLWKTVLDITGQSANLELLSLDFEVGSQIAAQQVESILALQPLPANLSFVYFGLFDLVEHGEDFRYARVGCYFAGGTAPDPETALDRGDLSYFPEKRFLNLDILNRIRELGLRLSVSRQLLDYVILFAATAIVAKNAVAILGIRLPVYVGFDSGDYALVSRGNPGR
jgi:hypothetical protein